MELETPFLRRENIYAVCSEGEKKGEPFPAMNS
jgi:hypothetical protein